MQIAGYSYSFGPITGPREIDHRAVVSWFRDRGVGALELYDPWMEGLDIAPIKDAIAEAQMRVHVCDVNCHVGARNPAERQAGLDRFHQRLRIAGRLGASYILLLPSMPPWESDLTAGECHQWLNEAIEASLPLARELGQVLLVANLGFRGDIYGDPDWVVETCEHFGTDVRTVYDVGNFTMAGHDSVAALERVYPYTVHVHLKDWITLERERPGSSWRGTREGAWFQAVDLGQGIVPLDPVIARLGQLGYDGMVSPEYEGAEDPWQVMDRALDYTRSALSIVPLPAPGQ